jgi:hypothetical protein
MHLLSMELLAIVVACCMLPRFVVATLPQTLLNENAALAVLKDIKTGSQCDTDGAGLLISRSWWVAARELVSLSHSVQDGKCRASMETVVRRHVGDMKLQADALLLSLAPADDAKVGVVRCATQWAQNSTAVFLSVKFSHRWSSPGALKVHDEKASVSACCFNFSASGEHSQLRKRYTLDLGFFKEVDEKRWSWQHAAAGRLTVEIAKKVPMKWPRLLAAKDKPGNLQVWEAMYARYTEELDAFERKQATEKRSGVKGEPKKKSKEEIDAEDERAHKDGDRLCYDSPNSPFYRAVRTHQLCEAYWPPKMKGKRGMGTTWLVLFYSPGGSGCKEREKECTRTHDKWGALEKKVPEVSSAKLGVVDCDAQSKFCSKEKVGHLPFVRRYKDGKRKAYYDDWDIDSVMRFVLA